MPVECGGRVTCMSVAHKADFHVLLGKHQTYVVQAVEHSACSTSSLKCYD